MPSTSGEPDSGRRPRAFDTAWSMPEKRSARTEQTLSCFHPVLDALAGKVSC
jgi:hypothetical protein